MSRASMMLASLAGLAFGLNDATVPMVGHMTGRRRRMRLNKSQGSGPSKEFKKAKRKAARLARRKNRK